MREQNAVDSFSITEDLEVNQLLEFEVTSGRFEGKYSTQVADIKSEGRFVIAAPFSQGEPVNVPVGGWGEVKVRDEGGVYILPVKVVARSFDSTPLLILELRDKITRIQERQFFRLELSQKTKYRKVADNRTEFENIVGINKTRQGQKKVTIDEKKQLSELDKSATIKDISAGGVKLSTEESLVDGQILEIDFEFMDASFSTLFGEIIRINKVVRNEITRYQVGLEFINSNQKHRDELTRWLFAKQRELRKKGLI